MFVDEAYAEFAGTTFIPELPSFPNVIVGRTFSKAFGLAGLRIGCLVGAPAVLDPIRAVVPVYSVNIAAVVAVQAALATPHSARLPAAGQGIEGAALRRLRSPRARHTGRATRTSCWSAPAIGCDALVKGAAERGVYLRDRSTEPGCAGCIRIATGIVEHTRRCIAAMEEVLCAAP